jgi:hypothetical protein
MFRKRASDGQVKVALKLATVGKSRNTTALPNNWLLFRQQPNSNLSKVVLKLAMFCKSTEPGAPQQLAMFGKTIGPQPTLV